MSGECDDGDMGWDDALVLVEEQCVWHRGRIGPALFGNAGINWVLAFEREGLLTLRRADLRLVRVEDEETPSFRFLARLTDAGWERAAELRRERAEARYQK